MRSLALLLALALPAAAASAEARPRVAVLDFTANGASKELASAVAGVAANELDRLGAFQVVTSEAIRSMLAFERQRQMLGCADSGCIAEIGGALGADWLVTGKVSRLPGAAGVPETLSVELTLTSVKRAQREGSAIETARSEAELSGKVGRAVQRLVQKVLAGRAGKLVVSAGESGAIVRVDDQVKGTTPLRGALSLPAGPHALAVEKQGFVAWQKDVIIEPGKLVEERAALSPSPDFARAWESRHRKLRAGAWISTGLAVAGLAGAVALQANANSLYGNESTPGTFLYARRKLQDGITFEGGVDLRAQASSLRSTIESRQALSYVSAGVGGLAAIAATVFWIAGEDPERYAAYREPTASLDVAPIPGGAYAAVSVGF